MGELLVGAVPAVYYETVQSAFSAVEDAGESDAAGAAAADILEAFVDMLQPGSPLGTWLARDRERVLRRHGGPRAAHAHARDVDVARARRVLVFFLLFPLPRRSRDLPLVGRISRRARFRSRAARDRDARDARRDRC